MVDWPNETVYNNPTALGRFKPEVVDIGDVPGGSTAVFLKTNLIGEPLRFTINETLDNIVSTANIVMLNAIVGDNNEIQQGVMGEIPTEEDEAQWGTLYQQATVEPNQLVEVWEIRGPYSESTVATLDDDHYVIQDYWENGVKGIKTVNIDALYYYEGQKFYTTPNPANCCHSLWRVVDVSAYTDDNDVPYYEVTLESLIQKLVEAKVDTYKMGSNQDFATYIREDYYDDLMYYANKYMGNDGYNGEDSPAELNAAFDGTRIEFAVESSSQRADLLDQLLNYVYFHVLPFYRETYIFTQAPPVKIFKKGDSLWEAIDNLISFNDVITRFNRECTEMYVWDIENDEYPPWADSLRDIGTFGKGLKFTYTKSGVCDICNVTGYLGGKDSDGHWIPGAQSETTVTVTSQAAANILNGEHNEMNVSVEADHLLENEDQLKSYGKSQLFKTVMGARGVSCESDSLPLNLLCGEKIIGTSSIAATTTILVTSISRTTDAQQSTIMTSISGTVLAQVGAENYDYGWE
jgi:hypothetical protein